MTPTCAVGLESLENRSDLTKSWGRCGLLCNQASVTHDFTPAWQILHRILGKRLTAFFGPQHGFAGTAQDNMIETGHAKHIKTGLPVFSLYSETREPTAEMLDPIDTLIVDLQIVGCRIYTWKSTIAGCLRAAKAHGKKVVVLDRPNPRFGCDVVCGPVSDTNAPCSHRRGICPVLQCNDWSRTRGRSPTELGSNIVLVRAQAPLGFDLAQPTYPRSSLRLPRNRYARRH